MKSREFINKTKLISVICVCVFLQIGGRFSTSAASLEQGTILLSEILYKVEKGQSEFIEIYNAGEMEIPLSALYLGVRDPQTTLWKYYDLGAKASAILKEKAYYVLSRAPENIGRMYKICELDHFIRVPNLPALTDAGGTLALFRKTDTMLLEQMQYNEQMHHPLLDCTMGVSLERVQMTASAMILENWHSAAQSVNYATPTCENSQHNEPQEDADEKWFSYSSDYISPNNDGQQDYLQLSYHLQLTNFICTIRIYDSEGRMVRMLLNQALLGTKEVLIWDGLDTKGRRLRAGMYIIFIELIHTNGKRKVLKKAVGVL
ncbi:MAG: gliding motility-associated C-terminal domain-containing protein [Bacteroidales bacterium]